MSHVTRHKSPCASLAVFLLAALFFASSAHAAASWSLAPSSFDFGAVAMGAHSTPATFTLANTGAVQTPAPLLDLSSQCIGCQRDERVLERWAWKYYSDNYAGMYFASGNRFVIGFTERQSSRVHAARRLPGLLGRPQVSGFPYVPKHSLSELDEFQQRILDDVMLNEAHSGLITSVGVGVQVNLVEVGAEREHLQKARELFKRLYGPDAPIRVRYEEPPVEV